MVNLSFFLVYGGIAFMSRAAIAEIHALSHYLGTRQRGKHRAARHFPADTP